MKPKIERKTWIDDPVPMFGKEEDPCTETIKAADLKLFHFICIGIGIIYLVLLWKGLGMTWYGIGILMVWVSFCFAIVFRWVMELKRGEL